jgi:hypothetical protein
MPDHDTDRAEQLDRIEGLLHMLLGDGTVTRGALAHHIHTLKRLVEHMGRKTDEQLARIQADIGALGPDLDSIKTKLDAIIADSDDATAAKLQPIADSLDAVKGRADALAAAAPAPAPPAPSKPVVSVTVSPKTLDLKSGGVGALAVVSLDADGAIVADAKVTFTSDGPAAVADPDGRVHGAAAGKATVTAAVGDVSDTCAVTVTT